jgi:transcriptional regulator with XRE-family HTH domain
MPARAVPGISTIRYIRSVASEGLDAGSLLRQARRGAGLSQVELASRAGVTQSVISAYESGHRQPSMATLAALVEAAGYELVAEVRPRPHGLANSPDP